MFLVEYQALARQTKATPRRLYQFIAESWVAHDFDNVKYQADTFDLALGMPRLHTVCCEAQWVELESVLRPELFEHFYNDDFWRHPVANLRDVTTVTYSD